MSRRSKKASQNSSVMEILLDPLFGLIGALIVVFIMQMISTINLVNKDLYSIVEETSQKNRRLSDIQNKYNALQNLLEALHDELDRKNEKLNEYEYLLTKNDRKIVEQQALLDELRSTEVTDSQQSELVENLKKEIAHLTTKVDELQNQLDQKIHVSKLQIKTMKLPNAIKDNEYHLMLASTGGLPPYIWSFNGVLPDGMSFDSKNGLLYGTSKKIGTASFNINLRDAAGKSDTRKFTLITERSGGFKGKRTWKEKLPLWLIITIASIVLFVIINIIRVIRLQMQGYEIQTIITKKES
jgi:Skp family chaperone for outer membrane proteins